MNSAAKRIAGAVAAIAAVLLACAAPAQADAAAPVYFRVGNINCSIASDDTVGCDLPQPVPMDFPLLGEFGLPWLAPVQHVVIDLPWLPAHPALTLGTPFTLPGGNPDLSQVATSQTMYVKRLSHGGTTCVSGFMGDVTCTAKGHSFVVTVYGIHAH